MLVLAVIALALERREDSAELVTLGCDFIKYMLEDVDRNLEYVHAKMRAGAGMTEYTDRRKFGLHIQREVERLSGETQALRDRVDQFESEHELAGNSTNDEATRGAEGPRRPS